MKHLLRALVPLFFAAALHAQEEAPGAGSDETGRPEEKVFISKEIIVKDKKEQAGVVSIITDKEVKNSTKTDLINVINQNVPSFYTGNNRVMGFGVSASGSAVISIRGIGKSGWGPTTGVPFLINGLDTTTSIMGHPIADVFTMKNIDRVEVLHGPQPVLYGSGALGGVVNIITKRQEYDGYSTEISGSYGSHNSTDDYVIHQGKMGVFDYGVSYNFQYTDGHREQTILGQKYTSEYLNHNATARFGFEIGNNWYASLNSYYMKEKINDPGADGMTSFPPGPPIGQDLEIFDISRRGISVNVLNTYEKIEGMLHVYANHGRHETDKPRLDISTYEHDDYLYGARIVESVKPFKGNKITAGAEVRHFGGTAKNPNSVLFPWQTDSYYVKDKFLTDVSGFGLVEQRIFDIITLSGGARYTDNSKYDDFVSWQSGIIITPLPTTKIYSSIARGFKLPELRQLYLYGPYPAKNPNPDLKAETYLSYEAGIEQVLLKSLVVSVTGYRIQSDNKIIPTDGWPANTWANADKYNYNGLEATAKYTIMNMVGLRAGYSYIDNEYRKAKLAYVPKHKALGGISFESFGLYAGLDSEYVYDVYADTAGKQKLSNYLVLNAKLAYTFLERYRAFVNFNNITDRKYETFWEYPMPGFTVMGGLSATL
ncbi:MAG: Colicin I receptor precursor [Spirochaetes bacterium ADurb.BinA120]|nr:MAG: Colicin I receptor precursor [Spirochaetes bacterium ADurb.BinA120]